MSIAVADFKIAGLPICKGIAIGRLYLLRGEDEEIPHFNIPHDSVETEVIRYRTAVKQAQQDLERLQKKLKQEAILEGAAIFEAHLQIMHDPTLTCEIERQIRMMGKNAEYVFNAMLKQFRARFSSLPDPYFQERSHDVEDIARRILGYLMQRNCVTLSDIPPDSIVFARDLTPSLVAEANQSKVAALVTETGGATSHAAIVARAKGIPYISSIPFSALQEAVNSIVIVDGRTGEMFFNPSGEVLEQYANNKNKIEAEERALRKAGSLKPITSDGFKISLLGNIDNGADLEMLHSYGASGVGLYRTESAFLNQQRFPSETEQYRIYREIVEKLNGLPIIVRTFDIGGDKHVINEQLIKEDNPFLGCRAIRFLLKEPALFKAQLRAILRAAHKADVGILFPMISSLSELREAKALLEESKKELKKEKIPFSKNVRVGCMIEVPASAIISDLLAKECDFLSIGTNDLVQYSLAADRSDESLNDLYTPTHPSIIRLIKMTVASAKKAGIPLSICGEVAADPLFLPLLIGLGVHELSVAPRFLPEIKQAIRATSLKRAGTLARKALKLETSQEIGDLLKSSQMR